MSTIAKLYNVEKGAGDDDGFFIASTNELDRDNDRVFPKGIETDNFRKNPLLVWSHNYFDPTAILGRIKRFKKSRELFKVKPEFREPSERPEDKVALIRDMVEQGFIRAMSIGFIPKEWVENEEGGFDFKRVELLEVSFVTVPANPGAALGYGAKGLEGLELPEGYVTSKQWMKEHAQGEDDDVEEPAATEDALEGVAGEIEAETEDDDEPTEVPATDIEEEAELTPEQEEIVAAELSEAIAALAEVL